MKRTWDEHELIEHWTLFEPEAALLANRTGTGKLAAAVLLKFFEFNGRCPRHHRDVPAAVLDFLGKQLGVEPSSWFDYDLKGRNSKGDREQIRIFLGFRPITLDDEERLCRWLAHGPLRGTWTSGTCACRCRTGVGPTAWSPRATAAPGGSSPRRFAASWTGSSPGSMTNCPCKRVSASTPWSGFWPKQAKICSKTGRLSPSGNVDLRKLGDISAS